MILLRWFIQSIRGRCQVYLEIIIVFIESSFSFLRKYMPGFKLLVLIKPFPEMKALAAILPEALNKPKLALASDFIWIILLTGFGWNDQFVLDKPACVADVIFPRAQYNQGYRGLNNYVSAISSRYNIIKGFIGKVADSFIPLYVALCVKFYKPVIIAIYIRICFFSGYTWIRTSCQQEPPILCGYCFR